jgi:hypothetical protein
MKRNWQTRSLFLACILSAPLLAGAEGSCGGGKLPIGSNNPDGGSGAKGGTAGTGGAAGTGATSGTAGAAGTSTAGTGGSGAGGSDVCSLPAGVTGPCNAAFARWTFNSQSSNCERFTYGGCEGNANNFETFEECVSACIPDVCSQPPGVLGSCDAAMSRWTFNPQSGKCEFFIYGGCDGNANNFETAEECAAACVPGNGEPCGPARCAAGQTCCNASCGICTAPGDGCIAMECPVGCAPLDARGEGPCARLLGYAWDGVACVALSGCSCVGLGCAKLSTLEACTSAHAGCDDLACASESRALSDFIAGNKSCTADADCHQQLVGCGITEDGCTGAVYLSNQADRTTFEALRTDFVECTGGCGNCKRATPPPACVAGRCGPRSATP